jgi:hypothetical protein
MRADTQAKDMTEKLTPLGIELTAKVHAAH